ncbi:MULTISPECIES: ABC transporter permease [Dermabacter]|uniref:ABC transporter permease n=1 Tax=Dermabacter vaginalis TaxID=1630135 RepID=A0A1B0ZJH7_9MICO|nr:MULTISPECIES: ABC transporter permease [Dermabacter]SHX46648.1 ABC-2 family transporter protein [Mycobacteroides abscessus subsp. abscessus]ANP28002.1 hypothetical protein DAD186_14520 [Dermabacter vaginalis]MCT2025264.1 ABC transporter permease [Dermabacter hominis]MCT2149551.1 ABC transporter permease [Dermabacter vaginalis]QEU11585.1 ABC transporter permease [Dermabacter vaginalis]
MFAIELKRQFRDLVNLFFIVGLPVLIYIAIGTTNDFADINFGDGNIAMSIMIALAAYGAASATTGIATQAGVEKIRGWGRQLGLTPLSDARYIAVKVGVGSIIALLPLVIVYAIGALTKAEAPLEDWILTFLILFVGSMMFGFYGLIFAFAMRSEGAANASTGLLVLFGFLGNLFIPLSGTLLQIGRFTPFYGYAMLAKYPVVHGKMYSTGADFYEDPLWYGLVNMAVWLVIFVVLALVLARKTRERQ